MAVTTHRVVEPCNDPPHADGVIGMRLWPGRSALRQREHACLKRGSGPGCGAKLPTLERQLRPPTPGCEGATPCAIIRSERTNTVDPVPCFCPDQYHCRSCLGDMTAMQGKCDHLSWNTTFGGHRFSEHGSSLVSPEAFNRHCALWISLASLTPFSQSHLRLTRRHLSSWPLNSPRWAFPCWNPRSRDRSRRQHPLHPLDLDPVPKASADFHTGVPRQLGRSGPISDTRNGKTASYGSRSFHCG